MSFTILDFILFGIMLISGLLALMRGFTREVLSLLAWGLAAVAAYFATKQQSLVDFAMKNVPYLDKEILAQIGVGAVTFIIVLIVVSIVSVKISDFVVDSSAGAFDRSLGFLYGLARGFVFVAIAYLFYGWLLPPDRQEIWVRDASSLPLIKLTGEKLCRLMPPDICETLNNTALLKNQASQGGAAAPEGQPESGYQSNDAQGLDNLIQGTDQQPTFGQSDTQQ